MALPDQPPESQSNSLTTSQPPDKELPHPIYDWHQFGRHALRVLDTTLIDHPLPAGASTTRHVTTLWPNPAEPTRWNRQLWTIDPDRARGWTIPHLACGDLLEFSAEHSAAQHAASSPWYGLVDTYDALSWLTVQGPYPTPSAAWEHAERLLGAHRYQPPATTPLRAPQPRHRRRHHRPY